MSNVRIFIAAGIAVTLVFELIYPHKEPQTPHNEPAIMSIWPAELPGSAYVVSAPGLTPLLALSGVIVSFR